jgi:hypothetical protein
MRLSTRETATVLTPCLALLRLRGVHHWRNNTGAAMLPGRGGKPQRVTFGLPGGSDIFGILAPSGRWLAVETKAPACKLAGRRKGRLSPEQRAFLEAINADGGVGLCIWDVRVLEAVLHQLRRDPLATFSIDGEHTGSLAEKARSLR